MPRNTKGGKNAKKQGNKKVNHKDIVPFATEPDMMYGKIVKKMGGTHMKILCNDNVERLGKIRGTMRKRKWMNAGDTILLSLRASETNQNVCDILFCYSYDDAKDLQSKGKISFELTKPSQTEENSSKIRFGEEILSEDDDDDDSDPFGEEEFDEDEIEKHISLKQICEPSKVHQKKNRDRDRDDKSSRLENLTNGHGVDDS